MAAYPSKPTLGFKSRTDAAEALFLQGKNYKQIAQEIGISDAAASALLTKVRWRRRKIEYLVPQAKENVFLKAAIPRGISQDDLVKLVFDKLANEPVLIDNIIDDGLTIFR